MNDQKIHDALDAVFNYELSRWMKANANTPPQSLRDGIGAVLNAAFYGSMDADELARNLETAERALWHARREVERVRDDRAATERAMELLLDDGGQPGDEAAVYRINDGGRGEQELIGTVEVPGDE